MGNGIGGGRECAAGHSPGRHHQGKFGGGRVGASRFGRRHGGRKTQKVREDKGKEKEDNIFLSSPLCNFGKHQNEQPGVAEIGDVIGMHLTHLILQWT